MPRTSCERSCAVAMLRLYGTQGGVRLSRSCPVGLHVKGTPHSTSQACWGGHRTHSTQLDYRLAGASCVRLTAESTSCDGNPPKQNFLSNVPPPPGSEQKKLKQQREHWEHAGAPLPMKPFGPFLAAKRPCASLPVSGPTLAPPFRSKDAR